MNKFSKRDSIYLAIVLILVTFDYIIKTKIKTIMQLGDSIDVIKNFFSITYVQNTGAAFGMFKNQKILFLIVGIVAILILVYSFSKTDNKIAKISISMVISGAIGNIIDRLLYGFVVDMFDFHAIWSYVFNFADVCVVLGVALLSFSILKEK
ncbi:MAG: signal peptidase II [Peptostreptococcaceae bacterium]|jgi:signal peptidase II|nr:signal peptidase II [Peptostreptococcaceae bacterium]